MRFKKKTDYCIRILIMLQTAPGKFKIQEIADAYGVSKNHLSVAANQLSDLGYIISTQGPKGGIEINPNVLNKSLKELIKGLESFDVVECFDSDNKSCSLDPHCKLKGIINKATKAFLNEFDHYKIKDLV